MPAKKKDCVSEAIDTFKDNYSGNLVGEAGDGDGLGVMEDRVKSLEGHLKRSLAMVASCQERIDFLLEERDGLRGDVRQVKKAVDDAENTADAAEKLADKRLGEIEMLEEEIDNLRTALHRQYEDHEQFAQDARDTLISVVKMLSAPRSVKHFDLEDLPF
jgi:chromosome segregation ATPase